jgi:hypothetical protein
MIAVMNGSDAGDLTGLAFERVTAPEYFMVDQHVRRVPAGLRGCRVAQDRVRERVGRVAVLGLARAVGSCFAELAAGAVLDAGRDPAADLGGDLEVALDHPVGRRPHLERPRRLLPLRSCGLVLAPRPRGDARVAQWDHALRRNPE